MEKAKQTDTRAAELLPLLQELVELRVKTWDVQRRIEVETFDSEEREFGEEEVDDQVGGLATACYRPQDAYTVVKAEDAEQFLRSLEKQQ